MDQPVRKKREYRRRDSQPQPWGNQLRLTERDKLLFKELQYGPLPPAYLFALTKHENRNYGRLQNRLTELYHGFCLDRGHVRDSSGKLPPSHDCVPFTYLSRPEDQELTRNADLKPLVYDLNENSIEHLRDERALSAYYHTRRSSWWVHDFMASCVAASIRIAVREAGLKYLTLDDIFGHESCPPDTHKAANPLALPVAAGRHVVPDDLFGIEFPTTPKATRCFYAVEIDRNTETLRPGTTMRKKKTPTIKEKFEAYREVFEKRTYQAHGGIRNLRLLVVTNGAGHADGIAECAEEVFRDPALLKRVAVTSKSEFGKIWKVPAIMADLFTDPWSRPDGTPFYLDRP